MKKLIWAFDPFENSKVFQKKTLGFLTSAFKKSHPSLEPVYVLSPDQLNLPIEFGSPWVVKYEEPAKTQIQSAVKALRNKHLSEPKVLLQHRPSATESAKALLDYARSQKADFVAVSTHARKGLNRFLLGSFTETLVLQASGVPLIIVNPHNTLPQKLKTILFATDLSKESIQEFKKVVALAKSLKAKIIVFNVLLRPMEQVAALGVHSFGGVWLPTTDFLDKEKDRREDLLKEWIELGKAEGVPTVGTVMTSFHANASGVIVQAASKHKADLIAVHSKSNPVVATLLGSTARQIVRIAKCPVWVVHQ